MNNVFEEIYERNLWGFGSGHGSLPSVTKGYRAYLQQFMELNNVKSVVDYGCGDWQFSKYVDWSNIDYTGVEVVKSLVDANNKQYSSDNISFMQSPADPAKLPKADLLIVKDVLQHLSRQDITRFIDRALSKYTFALITSNVIPADIVNMDIKTGEFRPLDLRLPPFNVKMTAVYSLGRNRKTYSIRNRQAFEPWKEVVLLYRAS